MMKWKDVKLTKELEEKVKAKIYILLGLGEYKIELTRRIAIKLRFECYPGYTRVGDLYRFADDRIIIKSIHQIYAHYIENENSFDVLITGCG